MKRVPSTRYLAGSRKGCSPFSNVRVLRVGKIRVNLVAFLLPLLVFLMGFFPAIVYALPTSGVVQAGSATIDQVSQNKLEIHQSSDKAIIDWRSFSIQSSEQVDFILPSASGMTLNRVTGSEQSAILGKLSSNGRIILINPNGILIGVGTQVDVNGLVATTSDIANEDFMAGRYEFTVAPENSATVVNRGQINVSSRRGSASKVRMSWKTDNDFPLLFI